MLLRCKKRENCDTHCYMDEPCRHDAKTKKLVPKDQHRSVLRALRAAKYHTQEMGWWDLGGGHGAQCCAETDGGDVYTTL